MEFRIREARERMGMNQAQLAAKLGIQISTLSGYETGKHDPKSDTLSLIAQICNTSTDFLLGRTENPDRCSESSKSLPESALKIARTYSDLDPHGKRIVDFIVKAEADRCKEERERREQSQPVLRLVKMPVYDDPAAAGEPLSAESGYEYVEFSAEDVPGGAEFGVRISGESMGETVPDGCVAFVRRSERADDGDVVIATLRGEGTVCKRLVTDGDRLLRLHSDNTDYPDIEGDSLDDLKIHGVVVGHT